MKKIVYLCVSMTSMAFGASSSTALPRVNAPIYRKYPFDPNENNLEKSRQILLSYTNKAPLLPKAKKALETACDALLWFADQNDKTQIETHKFHPIPYRHAEPAPLVSVLQHAWYGYRQVQNARTEKGLVSSEPDLLFMWCLETVVKAALPAKPFLSTKVILTDPNFKEEPNKEALEKLQAYAHTYTGKKRRPKIASPTKRERATTTRITDYFKAAASDNAKKPRTS